MWSRAKTWPELMRRFPEDTIRVRNVVYKLLDSEQCLVISSLGFKFNHFNARKPSIVKVQL